MGREPSTHEAAEGTRRSDRSGAEEESGRGPEAGEAGQEGAVADDEGAPEQVKPDGR